jgi:deoxycytidine triphosphate deaminase
MILSDRDLRILIDKGRLVIEPFDPDSVQPSSIDLRVGNQFRVFANSRYPFIDVRQPMEGLTEVVEASDNEPFILHPGEFVLGSTLERVALPNDKVGRLEGKSSLGRLGLLIHSSLPDGEPVLFRDENGVTSWRPVDEIVRKSLNGDVVAFDPDSFDVSYAAVTGWYEGPPDRIFEVFLASGRSVRVTAGHNLFTLDGDGDMVKMRTGELNEGTFVAIPVRLPDAGHTEQVANEVRRGADLPVLAHSGALSDSPLAQLHVAEGSPWIRRATTGDLLWDRVTEVQDTGEQKPIFDLEVRPEGRRIENFLAGRGGVFVSNTAGFVDAGFDGYLTLELSNVANLPITIYPGMKIGQLCLFEMSSPAERPYGSEELGSKYHGQVGPTPSRYYENFEESDT